MADRAIEDRGLADPLSHFSPSFSLPLREPDCYLRLSNGRNSSDGDTFNSSAYQLPERLQQLPRRDPERLRECASEVRERLLSLRLRLGNVSVVRGPR